MNENYHIAYNSKGLADDAIEETEKIVKDTYRALKDKNKFFNFQISFNPLTGISKKEWRIARDFPNMLIPSHAAFKVCGLTITTKKPGGKAQVIKSSLLTNLVILKSMLNSDEHHFYKSKSIEKMTLTINDVLSIYAERYFKEYKKTHKIQPNELVISWLTAIIITCVYYVFMIWVLVKVSPLIASSMLIFHLGTVLLGLVWTIRGRK